MLLRLLADAIVLLHLAYILYVLLGALLVRRRLWTVWPHLAAVAWGVYVAAFQRICPLTPLEVALRLRAGESGYRGGFVEHYLIPIIYPRGLTPRIQAGEAVVVVVVNLALYAWVWRARRLAEPPPRG
jgi:hypothetical protein